MASASTASVNEPARASFSQHSKATANDKSTNLGKNVSSGISDVAFASVTRRKPV